MCISQGSAGTQPPWGVEREREEDGYEETDGGRVGRPGKNCLQREAAGKFPTWASSSTAVF